MCQANPFSSWIYTVKAIEAAIFFGHGSVFIIYTISIGDNEDDQNSFIADSAIAITVDFIAGMASLTFAFFSVGGVCEDQFG